MGVCKKCDKQKVETDNGVECDCGVKVGMKKSASLSTALDILWIKADAPQEKTAAAYFYSLKKPLIDTELLGEKFCKMASVVQKDPWDLALEVRDMVDAYGVLAKTASDPRVKELAQFYCDWTDETLVKAAFIGAIGKGLRVAKAGLGQGVKNMKSGISSSAKMRNAVAGKAAPTRTVGSAMKREAKNVDKITQHGGGSYSRGQKVLGLKGGKVAPKTPPAPAATPKKPTFSMGEKALGAAALGGVGYMGLKATGAGQPQQQGAY